MNDRYRLYFTSLLFPPCSVVDLMDEAQELSVHDESTVKRQLHKIKLACLDERISYMTIQGAQVYAPLSQSQFTLVSL